MRNGFHLRLEAGRLCGSTHRSRIIVSIVRNMYRLPDDVVIVSVDILLVVQQPRVASLQLLVTSSCSGAVLAQ